MNYQVDIFHTTSGTCTQLRHRWIARGRAQIVQPQTQTSQQGRSLALQIDHCQPSQIARTSKQKYELVQIGSSVVTQLCPSQWTDRAPISRNPE